MNIKTASFLEHSDGGAFELNAGTIINGRYRIEEKIGEGGCGIVYRVADTVLNSQVALKFLFPGVIASEKKFLRVKREINLARKITDEKIIKVFSLEQWDSLYFLVMELVEGKSLKDIFEEKKRFSWKEFKPVYFEILEAIRLLHRYEIIHRDIKPSNIIVSGDNKVKILDFGLAKEIGDREKTSSLGEIVGSPYYMSPEQASAEELDFRTDIYSLGMILYRALTGKHPLEKFGTLEIINNYMQGKPIKLAVLRGVIPEFLKLAIKKTLEKKEKRFDSIEEMLQFFKRGKARTSDRLKYYLSRKSVAAVGFLIMVLLAYTFIKTVSMTDPAIMVHSIEKKESLLIARDKSGAELWQHDFSPLTITHAFLETYKSYHNSPMVFLTHPQNKSFSPSVSLNSLELDSRIVFLDNGGREVLNQSLIEMADIETYDFAKISEINHLERIDIDGVGNRELVFIVRHSRGMYPTAICILYKGELFSFSNPGGINYYKFVPQDDHSISLHTLALNNIFAHLMSFRDIKLESQKRPKYRGWPTFNVFKENDFKEFVVFLPIGTSMDGGFDNSWERGFINLFDKRDQYQMLLSNDYTLIAYREFLKDSNIAKEPKKYKDDPWQIKKIYYLMNNYYRERHLHSNLDAAYALISEVFKYEVKNPFLKCALLYFKGDLEILMGNYKKGEDILLRAIDVHSGNNDAIHRICEIEYLKGNPLKAIEVLDNQYPRARNFWGLGGGRVLFKAYCHLQTGNFAAAETNLLRIMGSKQRSFLRKCHSGILEIFKGNYQKAFSEMGIIETEFVYDFTVLEVRLLMSRAAILAEKGLARARFYFQDILEFSKTKKHLAAVSVAYFRAMDGKIGQAELIARPAFEKLLQLAKGDFETKLWLFYDAYIYGKTMELCGINEEAIRGYRVCLDANPHTGLAREAAVNLKRIQNEF
jgi:serine/threonine protein kinase